MLLLAVLRATQMYLRNKTERRIFQQGFTIETVLGSEGIRLRIVWVMLSWALLNAAGWGGEEFEEKRVRFSARNVYEALKSLRQKTGFNIILDSSIHLEWKFGVERVEFKDQSPRDILWQLTKPNTAKGLQLLSHGNTVFVSERTESEAVFTDSLAPTRYTQKMLSRKLSAVLEEVPLEEALAYFSHQTRIPCIVDSTAHALKTKPVTLVAENMSIQELANWLCLIQGLKCKPENGALIFWK